MRTNSKNPRVVLKPSAVQLRCGRECWESISLYFLQRFHHGDCIAQRLIQSNLLCLHHRQHNLRLQIATPDDQADGVQDGVAGPRLGGAWIVSGSRAMSVTTKFGVGVHLEALVTFGVQSDSLRLCGLEILDQVNYLVSVR